MIYTHVLARPDKAVVSPLDRLMALEPATETVPAKSKTDDSVMLERETEIGENLEMGEEPFEVSVPGGAVNRIHGTRTVWGTLRAALSHFWTVPSKSPMATPSRSRGAGRSILVHVQGARNGPGVSPEP